MLSLTQVIKLALMPRWGEGKGEGKISSIFGRNLIKGGEPGCAKSAVVSPVSAEEKSSMGFAKDAVSLMITARVRQSEFT